MNLLNSKAQTVDVSKLKPASRTDTSFVVGIGDTQSYLPITIFKGKEKGPVFTIVAGIHGYEYPPIVAVQELINEIDVQTLKGTLIVLPMANVGAFYGRTPFLNPLDGKNLNNAFPGSANGTVTEQIAHLISTVIIPQSDVFLDIHAGDANEDLLPFVCYYNNTSTPKQTALARTLSLASGFEYVVAYPYTLTETEPAKYAFKQATQKGITALSFEAGKLGNVQIDQVRAIKVGVYSLLSHLKMQPLKNISKVKTISLNSQAYIKVPQSGLFYSKLKAGDKVKKGEKLGYISNEFGTKLEDVVSTADGIILYKVGTPPVNKGETLFCIGY
ncbi:succinylglutamate desuccinylase/aspartoacylase family protein [Pedobacter xixiisoli]|uniref:Succinylglutamate desuccinylase/Aspartoacylase catalytic domain-containing protein n=1 Tax=Pedobacter xixiisoli TaxID=1476464 RepID=A0A285ZQG6_9SPHI|nr:M14 family metallopeptidase [Pedobacter xixiisoli]SOD11887.1 hypothetical protein SAMN06297358_0384 [Pedobacter xixiisoli]